MADLGAGGGLIVLLAALLVLVLLWIAGVLAATDLSAPALDARRHRSVLAVFPHADDEVAACGGALHRLAARGARVTLVLLTAGERGTRTGTPDPRLRAVRAAEARAAARVLGIADVIQADLGDGRLHERAVEVSAFLERAIERVEPDLLLTYDLAGLYGHPDHVACTEAVTALRRSRFPRCALWYAALPPAARAVARLVGDPRVEDRRAVPTGKLFVGRGALARIRAWRVYESQRASVPWLLPVWFALALFEHFEVVPVEA